MGKVNINRVLIKIANYSGWVLVLLTFLYFISGYGMTKGIMDPVSAKVWHEKWLPLPMVIAFLLHVLIYAKFALQRKIRNETWVNVYIIVLGLVLLAAFLYLYLL